MMRQFPTSRCRRCGQPIAFVLTRKKRRLPIDPEPDGAGNVRGHAANGVLIGTVISADNPDPPGVTYMPHFASCPKRK